MELREINSKELKVHPTIPLNPSKEVEFNRIPDGAEYRGSSFGSAVRVERNISLEQALEIAANDPEIGYFFYVKGGRMVLDFLPGQKLPESDPLELISKSEVPYISDDGQLGFGYVRVFHHGDVVFFSPKEGENYKWFGSAPGLADIYEKVN